MAYPELKYLSINASLYQFQDIGARDLISQITNVGLVTTVSTNADNTPYGVQWKSGTTTITGTWAPSESSAKYLVLVPDNMDDATGAYVEYVTARTGSDPSYTYTWEKIGTTSTDLVDYTKKSYFTSGHITIGNATAHSHKLPTLTASFTPAGTISFESTDYTATSATVTSSTTAATVTGAGYTPEGDVSITSGTTAITNLTFNSSAAANVTGASYTPAGTITVTDASHSHTLTSSTATATGRIAYVYGGSTTGGTSASLTTSTYSSVAYNVSVNGEVLVMDTAQMKPVSSWTTNTPATASFSTAYLYTASANAGITSGTFSGTAATITPTVKYSLFTGASYVKATGATFTGSSTTITPAVSYIKVTGVTYSKTTGATFSGTAGTPTVTYSTAWSTTATSTAVGGAASGTYAVLDADGGNAGVLSASYVPA